MRTENNMEAMSASVTLDTANAGSQGHVPLLVSQSSTSSMPAHLSVPMPEEFPMFSDEGPKMVGLPLVTEGRTVASMPPPTYAQVTSTEAPPPLYETLFGGMCKGKQDSPRVWESLKNSPVLNGIGAAVVVVMGLSIWFALPVAMVAVAATSWGEETCPAQPRLAIWLCFGGALSLVRSVQGTLFRARSTMDDDDENAAYANCAAIVAHVAWLVLGTIWLYQIYLPEFSLDGDQSSYCDYTLYMTSLVALHLVYLIAGVTFVVLFGVYGICGYTLEGL
ncbi:transmembrane protein 272-like [Pollicipes pollicipes]|uniref:transmembrane protein 272-like n=1 Tax=Pollicipes pollicipes TaxID=41117 RepID=UPI00188544BC|nr:transmembrane protein 272-like [Pollicipes pollicipes]